MRGIQSFERIIDVYVGSRLHGRRRLEGGSLEHRIVSVERRQHRGYFFLLTEAGFSSLSDAFGDEACDARFHHAQMLEDFSH